MVHAAHGSIEVCVGEQVPMLLRRIPSHFPPVTSNRPCAASQHTALLAQWCADLRAAVTEAAAAPPRR
eukprot:SAG11_NODE_134_length_15338_cov_3.876435_7_plen_68_part_00